MEIKIYKVNEYEWVAATQSVEDICKWYENVYGEELVIDELEDCDLDQNGMWMEFEDEEVIAKLDSEGTEEVRTIKDITNFGDVIRKHGEWWIFVSFREAIRRQNINVDNEPEVIASTEW